MTYKKNFNTVVSYLPFSLRNAVTNVKKLPEIMEIHLIAGKPLMLHTKSDTIFITENYTISDTYSKSNIIVTKGEIDEAFTNICEYSVYSKQNELVNGFITLSGGNRAGICGTAVNRNDLIHNIRDISSVNIRIANERIGCGNILLKNIKFNKGILICGAPCSGKTTILRDIARQLSYSSKVSLIDSRMELAAVNKGAASFDIGLCDVFNGYTKRDGFEHAVRCMSPEIIVCDELGAEDALYVENAEKSGVKVIASAHCRNKHELMSKPSLKALLKSGCFDAVVFLKDRKNIGQVSEIISGEKLNV